MDSPRCANVMPYADLGNRLALDKDLDNRSRNNPILSANSLRVPPASQPANAKPITGVRGSLLWSQNTNMLIPNDRATANQSRDIAADRSPRFQANIGPIAIRRTSGIITGTKVALKNGGPTDTFCPVVASRKRG